MRQREYEWVILAYYIEKGDPAALMIMDRKWFTGLSRTVYDIALRSKGKISRFYIEAAARDELEGEDADTVHEKLSIRDLPPEEEILKMLHALSYKFMSKTVRSAVAKAQYSLTDGAPVVRVKNELIDELYSAYEITDKKTMAEHMEQMKNGLPEYVELNDARLTAAGLRRIHYGNLMSVAGESGTGKTTTITEIMRLILENNKDVHGLYFSKEQPAPEIVQKFIAKETPDHITYSHILSQFNVRNPVFCQECLSHMATAEYTDRITVIPPTDFATPQDIADIVRTHAMEKKKVVWAVDYLTLLSFPGRDTQTVNIAEGLKILKLVAQQTRSIGILVSQLLKGWNVNPQNKKLELRFPKRSDMLWSSELINLSAYIIMLSRLRFPRQVPGQQKVYEYVDTDFMAWVIDKLRFSKADTMVLWTMNFDNQKLLEPSDSDKDRAEAIIRTYYDK